MVADFFLQITMSDTDFVRKKPTLQHAVKTLHTTQRDVHQYLADKGFQVGESWRRVSGGDDPDPKFGKKK